MPTPTSKLDNLSARERKQLVSSLTKLIANKKHLVGASPKTWKIPNSSKNSRTLKTYKFPRKDPKIWIAKTVFPTQSPTRDAMLVAIADSPPSNGEVVIAFEFNIARRSNHSRMNFRFQKLPNGTIKARCLGSFTHRGIRQKSSLFYDFLKINPSHGLTLDVPDGHHRQHIVAFNLSSTDATREWGEVLNSLSRIAKVVTAFKEWLNQSQQ